MYRRDVSRFVLMNFLTGHLKGNLEWWVVLDSTSSCVWRRVGGDDGIL